MDRKPFIAIAVAAVLWFVMFSPLTAPHLNFWAAMTVSALILTAVAQLFGKTLTALRCPLGKLPETILLGLGIAVALWWAFRAGDKISQLMFSFARPQVDMIYGMKAGTSGTLISVLLLLVIGPAEEIFWRGYVQRSLSGTMGADKGFIVTLLAYTLIHVPSLNLMLILAAMVCGVAWGGLYRLFPDKLPAIILSHALWDAAAFVWFPL